MLFHSLKLLPTDEVIEISASDLVTGYVGQTGKKTSEWLSKARGKVLFIDEAYQLNPAKGGSFMQEAVDELVKGLTSEEYKGKLLVILAGYEKDMDEMLAVNAGLRSRFSEKLFFENFSPSVVEKLLRYNLDKSCLKLSAEADGYLSEIAERLTTVPEFGNGRDADTLCKRVYREFAKRKSECSEVSTADADISLVEVIDLERALESMLLGRKSIATPISRIAKPTETPRFQSFQPKPETILRAADSVTHSSGETGAVYDDGDWDLVPELEICDDNAFDGRLAMDSESESQKNTAVATELENSRDISVDISIVVDNSGNPDVTDADKKNSQTNSTFYAALQEILDIRGLNTSDGVSALAKEPLDGEVVQALAQEISTKLGISIETVLGYIQQWQVMQADVRRKVEESLRELETAKKGKKRGLVPIWRCGVCGRADKPYIACYVAPFIVRYDEMDLN